MAKNLICILQYAQNFSIVSNTKRPALLFIKEFFVFYVFIITYNPLRVMCLPKVITSNHLIAYFNHIARWLKNVDVYILRLAGS